MTIVCQSDTQKEPVSSTVTRDFCILASTRFGELREFAQFLVYYTKGSNTFQQTSGEALLLEPYTVTTAIAIESRHTMQFNNGECL